MYSPKNGVIDYFYSRVVFDGKPFERRVTSKISGVYIIDDKYIGRSISVKDRIKKHVYRAVIGTCENKRLQNYLLEKYATGQFIHVRLLHHRVEREFPIMQRVLSRGHKLLNSKTGREGRYN